MRRRRPKSPLAAVAQGLAAGVLGNAVYTGYEMLKSRGGSEAEDETAPPEDWSETSEPARSASASRPASSGGRSTSSGPTS